MSVPFLKSPFLIESRQFPSDPAQLSNMLSKTYLDIAYCVNSRVNGIFEQAQFATGGRFFSTGMDNNKKRQVFRQVYVIPAIAAGASVTTIPLNISGTFFLIDLYGGVQTDVPDQRGLNHASVTLNANIEVLVDNPTGFITINVGAASPNVLSGYLILEYLLQS